MAGAFDLAAFEELKRQVEAWGLDDKQKGKFLMEEWRKMREAEQKKAEREAEEKKAEREAEEKKAEREAEEKKAEREAEREIERLRIELETKRLEATSREREQRTVASGMRISGRSPELPPFADGHDDLDNYLLRFERYAGVAGWEKQIWATQLSALLSGRALEVYSRLSQEDAMEYDVLKVALLTRYNFTEEGYRQRFREVKPANHESPSQFIVRLRNFFNKWVELSNSEATYEGVVSLMIYEQFINSCPKELAIHLKERKPKTVEEMAEWAEQYLFAHGRSFSWGDSRQKREAARSETKRTSGQSDHVRCYRCQGFGHRAEHCSYKDLDTKGNRGSEERDRKRCYRCGKTGHIARDCRIPQKLEESGRPVSSHKVGCAVKVSTGSEEETGEEVGVLELKSGKNIKVLNGACVNAELKDKMPVVTGRVEGKTVEVLRDTGCSGVIVRRDLVKEEEITNRTGYMLTVDRTVRRAPVGMVNIDTPYYTGRVEALCLQDPLFDLIVGNIEGARAPEDPDVKWDVAAAVVTRSQARKDIVDPPLKVKEITFNGVVTKERLGSTQREDESLRKYGDMKDILVRGNFEVTYEWHKGILYRTRRRKDGDGEYVRQVMTPNALRKRVMELAHDSVFSGHLGTRRTEERIQASFYWPGMHKDINSFCRSCDICQKIVAKGALHRAPLGKMPIIDMPFKRVAVDLVGPITPASDRGHRYILTLVDYATRYPEAVALKSIDTETVAEALIDIYSRLGIPEEVLSDLGPQFVSECMREVARLLSIKQINTSPYHPICNGLVERFNGSLKKMLRRLCCDQPKQWHRYINPLLFAYREVPQEATGFSPFELLYGRTLRGPMQILKELWTSEIEVPETKTTYQFVLDLRNRLEATTKLAQEELRKNQIKNKRLYDRKAKRREFKVGDKVLVLLPTSSNKLLMHWRGPYTITKQVAGNNYKINTKNKFKTYHANMLKPYFARSESSANDVNPEDNMPVVTATATIEEE